MSQSVLVTAGNTSVPIDQVRTLSNVFKGRTGEAIARSAAIAGWNVTLLSSANAPERGDPERLTRIRYRTFDELAERMETQVRTGGHQAVIHSAAVSDYRPVGMIGLHADGTSVDLSLDEAASSKIASSYSEVLLRLAPTYKIVDRIRGAWGFTGTLVKFKLQVGMSDDGLLGIARQSRGQSDADWIVANCLEWAREHAYIIGRDGVAEKVGREALPMALLRRLP